MQIIEDYRYTFANDDDGHWYIIPEDLGGRFYLLMDADPDMLCEEFDQYRVDTGVLGITFTNPRGID